MIRIHLTYTNSLKMKTTKPTKLVTLLILLFVAIACQDDQFEKEIDLEDEDMIAAIEMAEDYLNSTNARSNGKVEKSITVLKYKDGVLYYNTNTDDIPEYQVIEETSITAYAEPGEYVFWYSGGGVTDLGEIDFDETAEEFLENLPNEVKDGHMWAIQVPERAEGQDENVIHLKYDIVYETNNSSGPIRLDPKVEIIDNSIEGPNPGDN